nr:copia protein [Tanacetum cinerariifolium]
MCDEYKALIDNNTWVLVPRPLNVNIVRSMWLYQYKYNANGSLNRYKARLVANGRSQQQGIDCDETFSPVVKPATIQTVFSLTVSQQCPIHQLDVKNAFLHGHLIKTIYMHQPPGFTDSAHSDYVCLLQKSLYGLNQAPRTWFQRFSSYVIRAGFYHSKTDSSFFIFYKGPDTTYLLQYVDDIILTASSTSLLQRIVSLLHAKFAMTDLVPLNYFLGISSTRTTSGIFLSQKKYATEILEQAHMLNCNLCRTLIYTKKKLRPEGSSVTDPTLYRSLVGSLLYLTFTRPDLSYVVQQLCLYMHDPQEPHLNSMNRVLCYLDGTTDLGLQLFRSTTSQLIAYSDANWVDCLATHRSTSGYCVFLGDNLLTRSFKCQDTLSRSSAEPEYRGIANVVAETSWIRNLLRELHTPLFTATLVYCDNVNAVYMSANPVQHQHTKHIEIDIHFVRDKVGAGHVRVLYVPFRVQFCYKEEVRDENPSVANKVDNTASGTSNDDTLHANDSSIVQSVIIQDKPRSYVGVAGVSKPKPSKSKANFQSLSSENFCEGANFSIPRNVVETVSTRFANTLYGYSLGKCIAFPVVEYYVRNNWGKFGLTRIMMNSKGFFFFQFNTSKGLEDVLENRPWMIQNSPIILKKWTMNTCLCKEELTRIPVWVKIHDVHIQVFSEDGLSIIASQIGKPIMLDSYTSSMCIESWGRSSFYRCMIEINANDVLKESLTMDHFPKKVSAPSTVVTPIVITPNIKKTHDGFQTVGKKKKKGKSKSTNGGQASGHLVKQTVRYEPKATTSEANKGVSNLVSTSKSPSMSKNQPPKVIVPSSKKDNIPMSNSYVDLGEKSDEDVENEKKPQGKVGTQGCPNQIHKPGTEARPFQIAKGEGSEEKDGVQKTGERKHKLLPGNIVTKESTLEKRKQNQKAKEVQEGTGSQNQRSKSQAWKMTYPNHRFNSTLTGNARVWFDDPLKESIDSYNDLKKAFLENYLQQKKCIKDPVEIHNIKQRNRESTEQFMRRYKLECRDVKGAPKCMKISGFMHGITNPELIKRLHDKIPQSMDEMMSVTAAFLMGEMAASSRERKKSFSSWKQETGQKQNFKRGNFRNEQRLERKQDRFTLLTKTPREIIALDKGKFKPPSPMTTPIEKRNASKIYEFHGEVGHTTDECMHLKRQIEEMLKAGKSWLWTSYPSKWPFDFADLVLILNVLALVLRTLTLALHIPQDCIVGFDIAFEVSLRHSLCLRNRSLVNRSLIYLRSIKLALIERRWVEI